MQRAFITGVMGILAAVGVLLFPLSVFSQSFSKYAGEFLALGAGARPQALGSSFVAIADDATASYWNPAGLSQLEFPQLSLMHAEQFAGEVNYDFGSVAVPYKNYTFGVSVLRLGIDGIPDTRNALIDSVQQNGRIDEGERLRLDRISYFSNSDYAVYLSVANKKNDRLSLGGNIKLISRRFGDYSAWGIGFDAAALARITDRLTIGANVTDVTSTLIAWDTGTKELITPMVKAGASYLLTPSFLPVSLLPVVDADVRFEGRKHAAQMHVGAMSLDMHYGVEIDYDGRISVRSGIDDIEQVSFGVGVALPRLRVDYSFTSFDGLYELGDTHRISLILSIAEETFRR